MRDADSGGCVSARHVQSGCWDMEVLSSQPELSEQQIGACKYHGSMEHATGKLRYKL